MNLHEFGARLDRVTITGDHLTARCPAHEDRSPSLSADVGEDGRLLVRCHAGCDNEAVLAAMNITFTELFAEPSRHVPTEPTRPRVVERYRYTDEHGELLFEVERKEPGPDGQKKKFSQRRPDGRDGWVYRLGDARRVLYRLPEVLDGIGAGKPVFVVEGEKDVDALVALGYCATTMPGGVGGGWRQDYTDTLAGADVVVVADRDEPGYRHAEKVRQALAGVARTVVVVEAAGGKDAADHLAAGFGVGDFVPVVEASTSASTELTSKVDLAEAGSSPRPDHEPASNGAITEASNASVTEAAGALADGHRATDVGNADRLAASLDGRGRYVHAWRKWAVYVDGKWNVDTGEALITEHAKTVARTMFTTAAQLSGHDRDQLWKWAVRTEAADKIGSMIRLTRGIPGVLIEHTELDQHPWLLNVMNGTIDLRTGVLLPHDPDHLLSKQAPVMYDPHAEAPLWHACLERWQPDPDVRAYLQRVIGTAAAGQHIEHLFVNYGTGANGKGKFFGAIAGVLGSDYCIVPHKSLLISQRHEQHDTVKARLFGARMAVAAETDAGDRLDEAKVKELTGGDLLEARRMHEDPWQFAPTHTMFVHTNYRPRIKGGDEGIWRRVRLLPWDVTIPEAEWDTGLADKLQAEAPGILNWIITGAQQWHERGFDQPDVITDATRGYRDDEDHVGRFLADCCETGDHLTVPAKVLRETYEKWCADVGETPWNAKNVGAQLTARGFDSTQVGKARTRTWIGLDIPANTGGERL